MRHVRVITKDCRLKISKGTTASLIMDGGGHGGLLDNGAFVIFSWTDGWDHVSVSYPDRCPTWDEMCMVKDIFFRDDECVAQYHPAKKDYVNLHPYCLHLWRCQDREIPKPPAWMAL